MKISNLTQRKFIESYPGNGREVLTPNGYKKIIEIHKTIPYLKLSVKLENGLEMDCAYNHVFIKSDNTEIYAKDCLGNELKTIYGVSKVIEVINTGIEENMYDISIEDSDELYYTDGILSHNSGKSVSVGIVLTHMYNFDQDKNIGIVANKGALAREFLNNVKNMFIALPMWMQLGTVVWNKSSIENEANMRILTDVPGPDSFRGYSIHCLSGDSNLNIKDNSGYRSISLKELYDLCPVQIDQNTRLNLGLKIETPTGYQDFFGVKRSRDSGLIIHLENKDPIKCTKDHLFKNGNEFIKASNLRINDEIQGFKILYIEEDQNQFYYDPIEVQGDNTYIAEDLIHHNCLVVDECVSYKETITIRDDLTGEVRSLPIGEFYEELE